MDSVFRAVAVYLVLLVVTRLSGRRTLAEVTVFDFVLLLIIAETTDQALLGDDFSVTNAAIVIVTLAAVDVGLSFVKAWSPKLAMVIDGTPSVVISGGVVDWEALRRARVDIEDVLASAREKHGLKRLDQIDCAVLEVGGAISIIPKAGQEGGGTQG
ncbi:MAG: membrane protein [Rhodobacter sp. CACIA14H1]|nr:MAG: membrane protein [Rhodobacter sp. CACIA14H1]